MSPAVPGRCTSMTGTLASASVNISGEPGTRFLARRAFTSASEDLVSDTSSRTLLFHRGVSDTAASNTCAAESFLERGRL